MELQGYGTYASSAHEIVYTAKEGFGLGYHMLDALLISSIDFQGMNFVLVGFLGSVRLNHLGCLLRACQVDICANDGVCAP